MVDVRWERTWPNNPLARKDYVALDTENDGSVGRIYHIPFAPMKDKWQWFRGMASGFCDSKQEAADKVRAQWKADCAEHPELQDQLWPERLRAEKRKKPASPIEGTGGR